MSTMMKFKPLNPKSPDTKYIGLEPTWREQPTEERFTALTRAFNWYNYFYGKKEVDVVFKGRKLRAMIYYMTDFYRSGLPSASYLKMVTEGYIDHDLNVDQIYNAIDEVDSYEHNTW